MKRVTLKTIPTPFIDIFENQLRTTKMITRFSSDFFPLYTSFQKCKQSISYTGPKIWNSIPIDVKDIPELGISNDLENSSIEQDSILDLNNKLFITQFKKRMKKFSLDNVDFI